MPLMIETQATQVVSTQEEPPQFRHSRQQLEFPCAREKRRRCQADMAEPVTPIVSKLHEMAVAGSLAQGSSDVLFCDSMFHGLENPAAITNTVISWLQKIVADDRDLDYDPRNANPVPWHAAVQRVADNRGYHYEAFSVLLDSNISFLEHHETVLTHDEYVRSWVSPPQSCNIGMPASHRKTDQEQFVTNLLFHTEGAPQSWIDGEVLMSDGTKKGTENLLAFQREALLSSSETANTIYVAGHSDKDCGIAYLSKQRVCQWTQAEAISTSIGQGQAVLLAHSYKFGCRMLGQNEVAQDVMKPTAQCLQKRLAFGCVPEHWQPDENDALLPAQESLALIQKVHDYLSKYALPQKVLGQLNGYALGVYDAAAQGVSLFLRSQEGRACSKPFRVKLMFYRSDLLRQCFIVHRVVQGILSEAHSCGRPLPATAGIESVICALWRVRRQWQMHCALCRFLAAAPPSEGDALEQPRRPLRDEPELSHDQILQAALLK